MGHKHPLGYLYRPPRSHTKAVHGASSKVAFGSIFVKGLGLSKTGLGLGFRASWRSKIQMRQEALPGAGQLAGVDMHLMQVDARGDWSGEELEQI